MSFTFSQSRGFTFPEILVSLLILSIGLFGIASLQLISLKNIQQSYYHSIAQTQLASMIERLRVNQNNTTRECEEWNQENQHLLPNGRGKCHCAQEDCLITLVWKGQHAEARILR